MAVSTNRVPLSGPARRLVADGLLEEESAGLAFQDALAKKTPFVKFLIENGIVNGRAIAHAASSEFGVPMVDIDTLEIDPDTIKLVSKDLITKHNAIPLYKRGARVFIGIPDPTNLQALDEIKFNIGGGGRMGQTRQGHRQSPRSGGSRAGAMEDSDLEDFDDVEVGQDQPDHSNEADIDDAPVVRFANKCLLNAIKRGASDLHF